MSISEDAQHLNIALEAAGIGTWQIGISSNTIYLDIISRSLLGLSSSELYNYQDIFRNVSPKSNDQVETAFEMALLNSQPINLKFWIQDDSSEERYLLLKGKSYCLDGKAYYTGSLQDITSEFQPFTAALSAEFTYRSLIEEAPVATALYVGKELVIGIANDLMLSYWNKDRSVVGMKLEEAVPELEGQPFVEILTGIFDTGEVYQVTEAPAILPMNGVMDTYYFDFTYKPLYNTEGKIYAIMNMAVEVTERVKSKRDLVISEQKYRTLVDEAPVATCLLVGRELKVELINDIMLNYWGKDRSIIGLHLQDAVPELRNQPYLNILDDVFTKGIVHTDYESPAELHRNGVLGTYYFDFTYKPLFNSEGEVYAILEMAVDVTEKVNAKRNLQESEARFKAIVDQSPMAIGLLRGRDMIIELGNSRIFDVWGKESSIVGLSVIDALPEIKGQGFMELLKDVYDTGIPYYGSSVLAKLNHDNIIKDVYFDFIYTPLKEPNGDTTGIIVIANDVTEKVLTLRRIEESEAKFRALMNAASAAMILFVGKEDLIIDTPNKAMLEYIGKDMSINGKPFLEVMPEMKDSETVQLIRQTFETGRSHYSYGRQVKFINKGVETKNYYNITYTPLFDTNNNVYAVLDTAIDVTESIKSRKAIEEAEASLRGAIELAELGTWSVDPLTFNVDFSERMLQWHGLENSYDNIEVFNTLHERDRDKIQAAVANALTPGNGAYNEEYTIINKITGRERIIHAQGKAFFNDKNEPYLFMGTAQDITNQRQVQLALENEVKERTLELQVANRGLEEANKMLTASNEELAQYAYVASHDLQEPLRKISIYSNMLNEKDHDKLFTSLIDKIIRSSNRMSLLIKDLLEFSRLLSTDTRFIETDLNVILNTLHDDFELLIHEKNALIEIGDLPVINAVPLQMNQLFYNLISNALKFCT